MDLLSECDLCAGKGCFTCKYNGEVFTEDGKKLFDFLNIVITRILKEKEERDKWK